MRQLLEYAKMAFRNIVANKMRSLLTMLGIIIGISSVIIVLCLGRGSQQSIQEDLATISNGSVYIMVVGEEITEADLITEDDLAAIAALPNTAGVTMMASAGGTAFGSRADVAANISTGSADMQTVTPTTVEAGRFWNESDYAAGRRVCTIDSAGAKELFGSDNVLGMTLRLEVYGRSADFTIIGITQSQQGYFQHVTANISAPLTALQGLTEMVDPPYFQIALLANDSSESRALADQAVSMLELRHGNAGRDMYYVMDVSEYMDQFNTIIGLLAGIVAAIAGISLLVGGIGVMNIMLVSVTERTREIGIRKALGAKTRTILFQFLIESAFLTLVGGIIGIVFGLLGGWAVGRLVFNINAGIEPYLVVLIALFSVAIGIFFGIYPARKAARLNPIEALRSE